MDPLTIPEITLVQTGPDSARATWPKIPAAGDTPSYEYRYDPPRPLDPPWFATGVPVMDVPGDRLAAGVVVLEVRAVGASGGQPGPVTRSLPLTIEPWVPSRHLVVLPLPRGRVEGTDDGLVSVLLLPRFEMDGAVRHFREWRAWPAWVESSLSFSVEINGLPAVATNSGIGSGSARWLTASPSVAIWHALFSTDVQGKSTPVERYRFVDQRAADLAPLYDGPALLGKVRALIDRVARDFPVAPPTRGDLAAVAELGAVGTDPARTEYRDHMAPLDDRPEDAASVDPREADFHAVVGSLMAYPELLRRLGLLVDLRVRLPPSNVEVESVSVSTAYGIGNLVELDEDDEAYWQVDTDAPGYSRATPLPGERVRQQRFRLRTSNSFWPAETPRGPGDPDPSPRSEEFFGLINDDHRPETMDVGGAVDEIDALLGAIAGTGDPDDVAGGIPEGLDPDEEVAPIVPTESGIQLIRQPGSFLSEMTARWAGGFAAWQAMTDVAKNAGSAALQLAPIEIDARDVRVGWRYDVLDVTADPTEFDGEWRSLFARQTTNGFLFDPSRGVTPFAPPADEGWLSLGGFTEGGRARVGRPHTPVGPPGPVDPDLGPIVRQPSLPRVENTTSMRISPVLFRWTGFSLAVTPPGRSLDGLAGAVDDDAPDPLAGGNLPLAVDFRAVPGSLPRLRYGRTYRFRSRWVDLGGGSRTLDEKAPGPEAVTDPVFFGRAARIEAPMVARQVPRSVPGWGDTSDVMVIHSELGQPDATVEPSIRILVPPRTAQLRAELHGYPAPDGLPVTRAAFDDLVARDASTVDSLFTTDPLTGELLSADPDVLRPAVPYLADVAAGSAALRDRPGAPSPLCTPAVLAPFAGAWPAVAGTSVRLVAGKPLSAKPVIGGSDDPGIEVILPTGYTRTIEVSSGVRDDVLEHFDVAHRLETQLAAGPWGVARQGIANGAHWMISGRRELTFVHATRLPASLPTIDGTIDVARTLGESSAGLTFDLLLHRPSTERVDVFARSTFPVDTEGAPGGVELRTVSDRILEFPFTYDETERADGLGGSFRSGSERRTVELTLEAFSRYSRYFTQRHEVQLAAGQCWKYPGTPGQPPSTSFAEGSVTVRRQDGSMLAIDVDVSVDHGTGTVCVLESGDAPTDEPIVIDFVPLPISRMSTEADEVAGTWEVVLPNTRVPDPVDVVEALPAFARNPAGALDDEGVTVFHSGAVIRVWIARPWFTSGEGEQLAVVCTPRTFNETGADLAAPERWSRAARDPLAASASPRALAPWDFVRADDGADGVPLAAVDVAPGETELVDVALHEVHFDDARELWYADVELTSDIESGPALGYRPFVQLAVARYQPVSVDGAHLGPITMLETLRLGTIRELEVLRGDDARSVTLSMWGETIRNGNGVEGVGHEVRAIVQRSLPEVADRALSWVDVGDPVVLTRGADGGRWQGEVEVPDGTDAVRVVIEDAEILDRQSPGPSGSAVEVRNVVYIETVELRAAPSGPDPDPDPDPDPEPPVVGAVQVSVASPTSVTVSWPAPPPAAGVTGFGVQYQLGNGAWTNAGTTAGTNLVVSDLQPGGTYRFRVRVFTASGPGPFATSDAITLPPSVPVDPPDEPSPPPPPPPVASIDVTISSAGVASVSWPPLPASITGVRYQVQYSRDAGSFVLAGLVETTSLEVPGLQPGTYVFRVRPRVGNRTGPWLTSAAITFTGGADVAPYDPVVPSRILDTRSGIGVDAPGRIGEDAVIRLQVAGRGGVPTTGAGAVAINLTALDASQWTFVSAWPTGAARPQASVLNPPPGGVSTNFVVVPIGPDGSISLFNFTGQVHLLGDVMGWYPTGSVYGRVLPNRVLDTRNGEGVEGVSEARRVGAGEVIRVRVTGRAGIPRSGVGAVAINLTAVNATTFTFLSAWPTGAPRPDASVLNPPPASVVTNFLVVPVGADGTISIYNDTGEVHLLGDVMGWFPTGQTYGTVVPARVLDTRSGTGTAGPGRAGPGAVINLPVLGRGGIPVTGVGAVAINLTALDASTPTFVSAWPTGVTRPDASVLNPVPGGVATNFIVVPVGANGSISVYNDTGEVHLLGDVMGWFPEMS